jgi:putative Holliday junction resolvase
MDDTEAPVAARARRFARQLEGRYRLPVFLADERLTTREAQRQLGRDARRDALRVDAVAARLILETWLSDRN